MKRLVPILLVFSSLNAYAARVNSVPPVPWYADDFVRIEIDFGEPSLFLQKPEYTISNFEVRDQTWKEVGGSTVFVISGYPKSAGEVLAGPFTYYTQQNKPWGGPELRFPVRASLADASRPLESLRQLVRANRPAVLVQTALQKPQTFAGEEVVVEWWALGELNQIRLQDRMIEIPVEGISRKRFTISSVKKIAVIDGQFLIKRKLAELRLFPNVAGAYSVPSAEFFGEAGESSNQQVFFRRAAPPIQFEVLPRPAGARGPIGTFKLDCHAITMLERYWPMLSIEVSGSGDLTDAPPPRLSRDPDQTVILIPKEAEFTYSEQMKRSWLLEVHTKEASLPRIIYEYFDSARGENVELRCDPPPVRIAYEEEQTQKERTSLPSLPDPNVQGFFEISGIIAVSISVLILIRAAQD